LGSPPLVQALLSALLAAGCRLARPGEFLWRAFLAGKVDLTRVDALQGMLASGARAALRRAASYTLGGQTPPLAQVRDRLLDLLAEVEAGLDFADEDLSLIAPEALARGLAAACQDLEQIHTRLAERGAATDRLRVVLAGPPNAGKSSLFNALLGEERALVSPQAGTTRDYLSAILRLGPDVDVELIDTAGVEPEPVAPWEQAAQARRAQQTEDADVVLWCREAADASAAATVPTLAMGRLVPVWTKCDLAPPPDALALAVSSHRGQGLEVLRQTLRRLAEQSQANAAGPSLAVGRELVAAAYGHARAAAELADAGQPPELVAVELRLALDALGQLVGAVYTEDLLGRVFSQFCIGK
jgi:tRNA modification GTPase